MNTITCAVLAMCVGVSLACMGSDVTVDGGQSDGATSAATNAPTTASSSDDGDSDGGTDCKSTYIKEILQSEMEGTDPTSVSQSIQSKTAAKFGGNTEVICGEKDFAWNIWYAKKKQCKLTKGSLTCLAWLD